MTDTPLLDWLPPAPFIARGETFDASQDSRRLGAQLLRVHAAVVGKGWLTLAEIAAATGDPEASVSARLRDLENLGFTKERERVRKGNGLHRYRITAPKEQAA